MPKASSKKRKVVVDQQAKKNGPSVPDETQHKIEQVIASLLDNGPVKQKEYDDEVDHILFAFERHLSIPHVDRGSIERCHGDRLQLQRLAERLHVQTEKAKHVFELLDENQKGLVVLQDLERVAKDVMDDDNLQEEDLVGMIQLVSEEFLTQDDLILICRKIGL